MPALSELNSNQRLPFPKQPSRGVRSVRVNHVSDENTSERTPLGAVWKRKQGSGDPAAAKDSQEDTPKSKLPVRTSTPASSSPVASKAGKGQVHGVSRLVAGRAKITKLAKEASPKLSNSLPPAKEHRNHTSPSEDRPPNTAKPLPSPPVASFITSSPERLSRSLIDASERPLRRSTGSVEDDEWPTLSPAKPSTPTTAERYAGERNASGKGHPVVAAVTPSADSTAFFAAARTRQEEVFQTSTQPYGVALAPKLGTLEKRDAQNVETLEALSGNGTEKVCSGPVGSKAIKSPSGLTIGKAVTSSEPILHMSDKTSPALGNTLDHTGGSTAQTLSVGGIRPSSPDASSEDQRDFVPASRHQTVSFSRPRVADPKPLTPTSSGCLEHQASDNTEQDFISTFAAHSTDLLHKIALTGLNGDIEDLEEHLVREKSGIENSLEIRQSGLRRPNQSLEDGHSGDAVRDDVELRCNPGTVTRSVNQGETVYNGAGTRIRRLSSSPTVADLGPILTISHDAEAIIMGNVHKTGKLNSNGRQVSAKRLSKDMREAGPADERRRSTKQAEIQATAPTDTSNTRQKPAGEQGIRSNLRSIAVSRCYEDNVTFLGYDDETGNRGDTAHGTGPGVTTGNKSDLSAPETKQKHGIPAHGAQESEKSDHDTDRSSYTECVRSPYRYLLSNPKTREWRAGNDELSQQHPSMLKNRHSLLGAVKPCDPVAASSPLRHEILPTSIVPTAPPEFAANFSSAAISVPLTDRSSVQSKDVLSKNHATRIPRYTPYEEEISNVRTTRRDSYEMMTKSDLTKERRNTNVDVSTNLLSAVDAVCTDSTAMGTTDIDGACKVRGGRPPPRNGVDVTELSKTQRSQSRTRLAMSKIGNLFQKRSKSVGKRSSGGNVGRDIEISCTGTPLALPIRVEGMRKGQSRTSLARSTLPGSASPLTRGRGHPSVNRQRVGSASNSPFPANEVTEATAMAMAIIEKARYEQNGPKKDKLISVAAVLVDAITNARDAQRYMHKAQQAAKEAKLAHDLTQRSITELKELLKESSIAVKIPQFGKLFASADV